MYEICIIIFILIMVLAVVILDTYYTKLSKVLYRFKKLDKKQLTALGIACIKQDKDLLYKTYQYSYKDIVFIVKKRRLSLFTNTGTAAVMKNNDLICSYKSLSLNFRTGLYAHYLKQRYPKTFGKIVWHQLKSIKVNKKLKEFMEEEQLLKYILDVSH